MKTTRASLAFATLLALASATATQRLVAQDPPAEPSKAPAAESSDPIETTSPEAKKLAEKLHVAPNWRGKSGTVDLTYGFGSRKAELLEDWKFAGLEKSDLEGPKNKEPNPTSGLDLAAGSSGSGTAILDAVELLGDFTIDVQLKVSFMGPSSDLVFLVGVHDNEALGFRYGQQLVRVKKSGVTAITKDAVSLDKFASSKTVNVKIVRKGDELSSSINGSTVSKKTFTYKDLDGKIGLLLSSNIRIRVTKLEVKGAIAIPK